MAKKYTVRDSYRGSTDIQVCETTQLERRAEYAASLAGQFGMVAGHPDGEDSAGRAKLRLLTPEEVTTRACLIADLMFNEFEKRNWMVETPEPKPQRPETEEEKAQRAAAREELKKK